MQVVVTRTAQWIGKAISSCHHSIAIASPFVGPALLAFCRPLSAKITKTLLTRTRLQDFASGASSLSTLVSAAQEGFLVRGLHRLHAKVYVFDDRLTLVTSANATFSGLHKNSECGIASDDSQLAHELRDHIRTGFGDSAQPVVWDVTQLQALIPAVDRIKANLPLRGQLRVEDDAPPEFELPRDDAENLLAASAKWTHLVFRGILRLRKTEFTTQEVVDACQMTITREFPANRHARPKVRQQLQVLRDLGLVRFLTPGRYHLVMRISS